MRLMRICALVCVGLSASAEASTFEDELGFRIDLTAPGYVVCVLAPPPRAIDPRCADVTNEWRSVHARMGIPDAAVDPGLITAALIATDKRTIVSLMRQAPSKHRLPTIVSTPS